MNTSSLSEFSGTEFQGIGTCEQLPITRAYTHHSGSFGGVYWHYSLSLAVDISEKIL